MADPAAHPRYANPLTLLGAALTTISAVLFLFFFFLDLAGFHTNPYLGIVTFLLLPGLFVTGLLLIPLGLWRERRRLVAGAPTPAVWPTIDLRQARVRWTAALVALFTCVNFVILALASFKGVEYADSQSFCTGACHTPMEPQSVANLSSVHAAVACAQCHIAPGAPGFVKAKWGGMRQLGGVVMSTFPRPIPSPVHTMPAAEGTCLACHTATAHVGDVVRQIRTYADDEAATESVTTLTMRVGGGNTGGSPQIHWHANPTNRIEYIATGEKREVIPWVKVTSASGEVREYTVDGVTPGQLAAGERRLMDCTDCHNRLGHPIAPSAERAIDDALAQGRLPKLPFIRREAVAAIRDGTRDRALAERQIAEHLGAFYARHDPTLAGDARVAQAIAAAQQAYAANVFPAMKVTWGTYANQQGHTEVPGCFRCHDDLHKTRTGLAISQDCESCHRME